MGRFTDPEGIALGDRTRWVVAGIHDYELFFRNVDRLLPASTAIVYFEGFAIAPDVRAFLEQLAIASIHKVKPGTDWPTPFIFHLPATPGVLRRLADLAHHRPTLDIASHCHFYTSEGMVLQWYDACDDDCPIGVGPEISEDKVQEFCRRTGATYEEYKHH